MIVTRAQGYFLVWHDQFKTSVLAQAAIPPCARLRDLVAADTTPIANDSTDIHAKVTCVNSTSAIATQAVADKNTRSSRSAGTNKHARALAARKLRQGRHVYSHDVERSLPSSVGAACGRAGSERLTGGS